VERDHCVHQSTDGKNVIKCIRKVDYVTDRDNAWRSSVLEHGSTNSTTRKTIRTRYEGTASGAAKRSAMVVVVVVVTMIQRG
jgi:hypothetical protein